MMNLKRLFYTLSFLLIPFVSLANGFEKDSITIQNLFKSALLNPAQGDSINQKAQNIVNANTHPKLNDSYLFFLSKFLFQTGQLDSALTVTNMGISQYTDSLALKSSKFHNIKGSVYAYKNDYEKAIAEYQRTIEILELNESSFNAAIIKSNIANLFFSLRDYESAYKYSFESYTVTKSKNDTVHLPRIAAVLAISSIKRGDYDAGKKYTSESLQLSEKYNNPLGLILGYLSKGELNLFEKDYSAAENSFSQSLELSLLYQQPSFIMLNKIGLLQANLELKRYDKAVKYGTEAVQESKALGNENTLYSIYKKLGYAYAGVNNYTEAYNYSKQSHDLYIESADIKNQEIINDILIKYDTEKKERELVKKELEIAQSKIRLSQRNFWIITLSALIILLIIIYLFYRKLQKEKFIKLQKEEERNRLLASIYGEERERERISHELHDGVASSLTGIKIKLEQYQSKQNAPLIKELVNQLTVLHDDTRRISHNLIPISLNNSNLIEAIGNYCRENSSDKLKINFIDNTKTTIQLKSFTSTILYRTVQELINNVQKHSKSSICYVQTVLNNKELIISIEDEGVGFSSIENSNAQGISSITERIKDLGGDFIIDSKPGQGTLASIHLNLR